MALTAACFTVFQVVLDPPLQTDFSTGIVSFELAHTPEAAMNIVNSWNRPAQLLAAFSLGFDFLFMPLYATALSAGLLLATSRLQAAWHTLAHWLGWGAYGAVVFDVVENIALFSVLSGRVGANPQIAFWCACAKFALLLLGLGYALTAGLATLLQTRLSQ